jgi:hypothetical protein
MDATPTNGINRVFPNGAKEADPHRETEPAADANPGRDAHGRFAKGNAGGPGNPFARQVAGLRRALIAAVTEEDMHALARTLLAYALEGNMTAAKLLLQYVLGKPPEPVDPDTLSQREWQLFQEQPITRDDLMQTLGRFPLNVACDIVRTAQPGIAQGMMRMAAEVFQKKDAEVQKKAEAAERQRVRRRAVANAAVAEAAEAPEPGAEPVRSPERSAPETPAVPTPPVTAAVDASGPAVSAAEVLRQRLHQEDEEIQARLLAVLGTLQGFQTAAMNAGARQSGAEPVPTGNGDNGDPPRDGQPPSPNGETVNGDETSGDRETM